MPMRRKPAFRKKRTYSKKSSQFTKAVAKIAKAVNLRAAETKSPTIQIGSTNLFDASVYARNLIYPINQGSTSEQVVGEKIMLKNIRIKGHVLFNGTTERDKFWRMLIIRSEKFLTTTQAIITYTDVFRSSSNNSVLPSVGQPDLHKISVLYDSGPKVYKKQYATHIPRASIDLNIQINKTHYFDGDSSGVLKGGNYYFVFVAEDFSAANMAQIVYDWTVNFKDD